MAPIYITNTVALIEQCITLFCFSHNLMLLLHTIHHNRKSKELNNNKLSTPLNIATYLTLISYIFFNIACVVITCIQYYMSPSSLNCFFFYISVFATYYVSKYFIWMYSIVRLKVVFSNTPSKIRYSDKFLLSLTFVFAFTLISLCVFCLLTVDAFQNKVENPLYCAFNAKIWFYIVLGVSESVLSVLCYWLFYRKMKILMGNIDTTNYALLYLLRKYAILSAVSIVSTWIAAMYALFTESGMGIYCLDSIVNLWCILLFDARHNNIYVKFFGCIAKKEWNVKVGFTVEGTNTGNTGSTRTGTSSDKHHQNKMNLEIAIEANSKVVQNATENCVETETVQENH
eukprot:318842_1